MTNKKNGSKYIIAIAACFVALAIGIFTAIRFVEERNDILTVICFDVNPSIELKVNSENIVTHIDALNNDAEKVIDNMKLEGTQIEVAVNALVTSMLKNGYISDLSNSVLISVEGDSSERNQKLQSKVSEIVTDCLKLGNINPAIVIQEIHSNNVLKKLADQADVSVGKVQFVQDIIKADNSLNFDELIVLPVNELYLIVESLEAKKVTENVTEPQSVLSTEKGTEASTGKEPIITAEKETVTQKHEDHITVPGITHSGIASEKEYISRENALKIALDTVGLTRTQISSYEIELDYDNGKMVYDVEMYVGIYEYDVELDARSGKVIKKDVPSVTTVTTVTEKHEEVQTSNTSKEKLITENDAKNIALKAAGISQKDAKYLFVKLEREKNGKYEYEVDFKYGGYEYEYEIDAVTGKIIKSDKEIDN